MTPGVDCTAWGRFKAFFDPRIPSTTYAADAYQCAQYGSIPAPGTVTAPAPQTLTQMTVPAAWTPEQAINVGSDYAVATDAAIAAAMAAGTYNPAGNLPVTASWLDTYKWPLIAAAIAAIIILPTLTGGGRRRNPSRSRCNKPVTLCEVTRAAADLQSAQRLYGERNLATERARMRWFQLNEKWKEQKAKGKRK